MLNRIIHFSVHNKFIVFLFTLAMVGYGIYALMNIPIGAVPDITNNQVQVITTSRNLSTQDVEQFLTYPVEMEMANLPGVKEIRSVSKFGLSVVTVVFEEAIGTYLPRQLIAEKLKSAQEQIPEGFGTPFMGPISTGLGEIYQYILDLKPGYEDKYTPMDLRTLQDWVVKRQLSGIPGVVEVNTWGGFLKQYEVAVDPKRLSMYNITLQDVYRVMNDNNSIAGGGYIEKTNETYFIRGEGMVKSMNDIENIVIDHKNGVPIYIKNVAKVQIGHATRFGAITSNGTGEKVLGQIMMLKGADSKSVIEKVKARVDEIQSSLPEGVFINPIVERSELIEKTTSTIAENLLLGCLIVIFVVVLLLGNIRSGLVVASVIPLCLLFAISLMYIFGIDANLMSLGAIDFGIIIDGAVIIVEYIAYRISHEQKAISVLSKIDATNKIDKISANSASKMMKSAIFGQLIIIIVFIPILSLAGVEGKMFKPMAITFCFALIGAMLLCLTYVPAISALMIKPEDENKATISSKLLKFITAMYTPTLLLALRYKKMVVAGAIFVFLSALFLFSKMGGEFVPTLDEGDFVIQPVLKTGTSLSATIKTITEMEKIIMTFPEVEKVVSRIGAAEVPTDPMSMEESDVIIKLKPKKEWKSASTKDELADKIKDGLSIIPGIEVEFTQPIEMRFNELITGVRSDLAIKVFGEDLQVLNSLANKIKKAIDKVEGASDVTIEKVAGLPQMTIKFDREKIARYGMDIATLNEVLSMGFAGMTAGNVFEGEKRFDMVLRYDKNSQVNIDDLKNAPVKLPNGGQMPLSEFADISYTTGPAKISRDDTKRRIVIGVNVRNRDLESVVTDVRNIINDKIKMPVGYSVKYGGQFENLENAKRRLMVAVPIALVLIFVLLYFAFNSVKDALLIYSAIPLSAIGGIILLYMRDLPFSISAGVGFIALFGIAVLNGIVLIEHFKELKAHGLEDIHQRVLEGTKQRLRPVLLTASAAALGFLPMAMSTSAGAEVQRPLATVVVGGLISATLLTLIVLPILYTIFEKNKTKLKLKPPALLIVLLVSLISFGLHAQRTLTLDQAIDIAISNNNSLKSEMLKIEHSKAEEQTYFDLDKTGIFMNRDENNINENGHVLNVLGASQNFKLPQYYKAHHEYLNSKTEVIKSTIDIEVLDLKREVSELYNQVLYSIRLKKLLKEKKDNIAKVVGLAKRKYELGESNLLEKVNAEAKMNILNQEDDRLSNEITTLYSKLRMKIQLDEEFIIEDSSEYTITSVKEVNIDQHPIMLYYDKEMYSNNANMKYEAAQHKPNFAAEYFLGNSLVDSKIYSGFQIGMNVSLSSKYYKAKENMNTIQKEMLQKQKVNAEWMLKNKLIQLKGEYELLQKLFSDYESSQKELISELKRNARLSFENGEINFLEYSMMLDQAYQLKISRLAIIRDINEKAIQIKYLN